MDPMDDISNEDGDSQHDMGDSSSNSGNKSIEIMERTHDYAMDIDHNDGLSDNILNGQANQANNQKEEINLLEMPTELLERILGNLDDKNMLKASHVCKSFASAVEKAFARKYSNRYFVIQDAKSYQKVMLPKYGGQIRWIHVNGVDEEILDLMEQHCRSLERTTLMCVPKMIRLKNLKKISLTQVGNLNRGVFAEFISDNQQLESLELKDPDMDLINVLNGRLNSLKRLTYYIDTELTSHLRKIRLNSLETLSLQPFENGPYVRFLPAFECNQLKLLDLEGWLWLEDYDEDNDEVIDAICKFKALEVLKMPLFPVTTILLAELAAHLPSLTELAITTAEKDLSQIVDYVLSVLSISPKLSKLSIYLDGEEHDFEQFVSDVKAAGIDSYHGRFAGTNTEIEIGNQDGDIVFTSKDFAYVDTSESLELHWMANLNETNMRSAIAGARKSTRDLKFINHCAGNTLDICAFLTELHYMECLDIKSGGPITFKANSSRHHNFFPKLKILKIHEDEDNAIDFLQKLDNSFCERIQELWLETKARNPELEHTHDMTNILSKFKNLTSLNLVPAFDVYDSKHIWSVCRKLKSLNVRRLD